jgi:hypothetical protein
MKDLQDVGSAVGPGAGAGLGKGAGIGPYDPTKEKSLGTPYYKAIQKDLTKRYGKNGMRKNPPSKKWNKIAT